MQGAAAAGGGGGGGWQSHLQSPINIEDNSPPSDREMADMISSFEPEKEVLMALRERLRELDDIDLDVGKTKKIASLKITFTTPTNKINYETIFRVEQQENSDGNILTYLDNNCIKLWVIDPFEPGSDIEVESKIQKNDREIPCFSPRLQSYPGVTTTDVLQILKIKLNCLIPSITHPDQIKILDKAYIDGLHMTSFRLLRGDKPFYSKYGFKSSDFDEAMAYISRIISRKLKDVFYRAPKENEEAAKYNGQPYFTLLPTLLPGLVIKEEDSIINIMKLIPAGLDADYNLSKFLFFSLFPRIYEDFWFQYNSPEWYGVKDKVIITGFELKALGQYGGKRGKRGRSRTIKRKGNLKRKNKRTMRKSKSKSKSKSKK